MAKTKIKGTAKTVGDTPVPQPITIRSTNPKIMADNILKLEESIKAADVSANPSGTAEKTLLSTIGIDGKKYELGPSAKNTSYDNTDSGLTATETQGAIDELAEIVAFDTTIKKGAAYNLSNIICAGHNSGSGNYVEIFIPCQYDDTIANVALSNTSSLAIYAQSSIITETGIDFTDQSVTKTALGLRLELKYAETKTASIPVSVGFGTSSITFS